MRPSVSFGIFEPYGESLPSFCHNFSRAFGPTDVECFRIVKPAFERRCPLTAKPASLSSVEFRTLSLLPFGRIDLKLVASKYADSGFALPADMHHRPRRFQESRLADVMPGLFPLHGTHNIGAEFLVAGAGPQAPVKIVLHLRKKAGANLAV